MSSDQPIQIPPTPQGTPVTSTVQGEPSPTDAGPGHTGSRVGIHWPTVADGIIVTLLLALAFLIAASSIRHDEFWRHLGTGRAILEGQYSFGSDPKAFADPERTWVNHSWLFDITLYSVHSIDEESAVVIVQALLVALFVGLIVSYRTLGQGPIWMWSLVAAVALVTMAPMIVPLPILVTLLFLTLTLRLLISADPNDPSWKLPVMMAILFALWANFDRWFILGPLMVALWLAGAVVQRFIADPPEPESESDLDPAPLPESNADLKRISLALVAGLLATLANPHFVGVWSLPAELTSTELALAISADPVYGPLFESPLNSSFYDARGYSNNPVTAVAYFLLLALGILAISLNIRRVRGEVIAVWLGFAILSLIHARAVPYFAVIGSVLAGWNFAEWGRRWVERHAENPGSEKTRVGTLIMGRTVVTITLLGLLFAVWPGWLNSQASDREIARRVGFGIRDDESLRSAAEALKTWRDSGALPSDAHGLSNTAALAHYCAWFAPSEPSFFDHRYAFRVPDATDYGQLRDALRQFAAAGRANPQEVRVALERIEDLMRKHDACYLTFTEPDEARFLSTFELFLLAGGENWVPWYFDGQTAIFGWKGARPLLAERFRFNPVQEAFGPDVEPTPKPEQIAAPTELGFWERYAFAPPRLPLQSGRSQALSIYAEIELQLLSQRQQMQALQYDQARRALMGGPPLPRIRSVDSSRVLAAQMLAIRQARQAIALSPDHPRPYFSLAGAYESQARLMGLILGLDNYINRLGNRLAQEDQPDLSALQGYLTSLTPSMAVYHQLQVLASVTGDAELATMVELLDTLYARQVLAAMERCRARMPTEADDIPQRYQYLALQSAFTLSGLHRNFGHIDIAEGHWEETFALSESLPDDAPKDFKDLADRLRDQKWRLPPELLLNLSQMRQSRNEERGLIDWGFLTPKDLLARLEDQALLATSDPRNAGLVPQFLIYRDVGMSGYAIARVRQSVDTQKIQDEVEEDQRLRFLAEFFDLEIKTGQVEQAVDDLDAMLLDDEGQTKLETMAPQLREVYRNLQYRAQLYVGNYPLALAVLDPINRDPLSEFGTNPIVRLNLAHLLPLGPSHPWVTSIRELGIDSIRQTIQDRLTGYAQYQLQRGMVLLEAGRIDEARESFRAAIRPHGIEVSFPSQRIAATYLQVISSSEREFIDEISEGRR